jgi:CDP-paratose 2-epimerase
MDDLLDSFDAATADIEDCSGEVFNIGGGGDNTISLLEFLDLLGELFGRKINYTFSDWRPGDQKIYVSDITKAARQLNWKPQISNRKGIKQLYDWASENQDMIERALPQ